MPTNNKIPLSGIDPENISQLSQRFTSALTALQSSGADSKTARFIFENTGIVFTYCERLIEMRVAGIDNHVLESLLDGVF